MSFGIYCPAYVGRLVEGQIVEIKDRTHWSIGADLTSKIQAASENLYYLRGWYDTNPLHTLEAELNPLVCGYGSRLKAWRVEYKEQAAKPSKVIRKWLHETTKRIEDKFQRPYEHDQCDTLYRWDNLDAGLDMLLSKYVTKLTNPHYKVLLSRSWPSDDTYYGDHGACFYPGGCNDHCPEQIFEHGGFILKVFAGSTPDHVIEHVHAYGEDDAERSFDMVDNCWPVARALLMPCKAANTYYFTNYYCRPHVSLDGGALRDLFANAIRWKSNPTALIRNGSAYFINTGHYKAVLSKNWTDNATIDSPPAWRCPDCDGEQEGSPDENGTYIEAADHYVCSDCACNYSHCESCETMVPNEHIETVRDFSDGYSREVCDQCRDNDSDIIPVPSWLDADCYYIDLGR